MEIISQAANHLIQKDTNTEYHANEEYVGASGLKIINQKSPYHFFHREPKEQTAAMIFGSAYHHFVLEPETFPSFYFVLDFSQRPESDKNFTSTKNKEWKADIEAKCKQNNWCIISAEDYATMNTMRTMLYQNPNIKALLVNGLAETSYYTTLNGVKVKTRPDYIKKRSIIDLKTCEDASPEGFSRQCKNFDYHLSAAFYQDVHEVIDGVKREIIFIAQEKSFPYYAQIYLASEGMLQQGRYEYTIALKLLKQAQETGNPQGYEIYAEPESRGIITLDLPAYAYREKNIQI